MSAEDVSLFDPIAEADEVRQAEKKLKSRKPLTPEQRAAKSAKDKARRAKKAIPTPKVVAKKPPTVTLKSTAKAPKKAGPVVKSKPIKPKSKPTSKSKSKRNSSLLVPKSLKVNGGKKAYSSSPDVDYEFNAQLKGALKDAVEVGCHTCLRPFSLMEISKGAGIDNGGLWRFHNQPDRVMLTAYLEKLDHYLTERGVE